MDMRYHWIRDRGELKDFDIVWRPADYLTKTQSVAKVLKMRKYFVKPCAPAFKTTRSKSQFLPLVTAYLLYCEGVLIYRLLIYIQFTI
jgi:hypothetical protein